MSSKKYLRFKDFYETGKRIRDIRRGAGLKQREFGNLFGVSQNTVSQWEKGKTLTDQETLKKIADYGGVTVEWLLHGEVPRAEEEAALLESPPLPSILHEPALFGGIDIGALALVLDLVEESLSARKKPLKSMRKALLISLLYDHFQKTGHLPDRAKIEEFLKII
jgi:transcriptional regulator with XRE-family HTH domain